MHAELLEARSHRSAGGSATFVDPSGATVPINPAGGIPALTANSDCLLAQEGAVGLAAVPGQLRYRPNDRIDIISSAITASTTATPPPRSCWNASILTAGRPARSSR